MFSVSGAIRVQAPASPRGVSVISSTTAPRCADGDRRRSRPRRVRAEDGGVTGQRLTLDWSPPSLRGCRGAGRSCAGRQPGCRAGGSPSGVSFATWLLPPDVTERRSYGRCPAPLWHTPARMADTSTGQPSPPVRALTLPALGWRYELTEERRYVLRASILIFIATFLIYWALGPHKTAVRLPAFAGQQHRPRSSRHDRGVHTQPERPRTRAVRRAGLLPAGQRPARSGVVRGRRQPAHHRRLQELHAALARPGLAARCRLPSSSASTSTRR